jgi:hypothetical protein
MKGFKAQGEASSPPERTSSKYSKNSALPRKQPAFTFFVGHFCLPRCGSATLAATNGSAMIRCYIIADSALPREKIILRLRIVKAKLFY